MNAVRLAPGLLAAGVTPVYAVARGPGTYADFLPSGVEVRVLDTGGISSSTLRLIRASSGLARLIDERRPQVLCPVMAKPSIAALSALKKTRHRPTTVLSIQNSLSVSHGRTRDLAKKIELGLIRKLFPRADGIIALSRGVADELRYIVPTSADNIVVVHNVGLPLPTQMTNALALPRPDGGSALTVLACGRLTEQKDYPTLLRAFALLRGDNVRLNILGEGKQLEALSQLARDLQVAEMITFLGFQRDPLSYMRKADIFVLSSRWEGFGNVLVEAMAMGAPVVSTDCPHGPGEIIIDGKTGILVPTGAPDALASALQRLIDDPQLRFALGSAGQRRAQDFSTTDVGAAYARHFREFVARRHAPDERHDT